MCVLCGQLYLIICYLFKQATNYDVIWPLFFDRWIPRVGLRRVFFNLLMTAGWMPLKETGWEHGGLRNYCGMSWCLRRSRLFLVKMLGEWGAPLSRDTQCFINTCFGYESWLQEKLSMRLREWEQTEIMVCAPSCIPGSWCCLIFKCFITIFDDLLLWKSIWGFAEYWELSCS